MGEGLFACSEGYGIALLASVENRVGERGGL